MGTGTFKSLATDGELMSFKHYGFWQPMDNLRDKVKLNELLKQISPLESMVNKI